MDNVAKSPVSCRKTAVYETSCAAKFDRFPKGTKAHKRAHQATIISFVQIRSWKPCQHRVRGARLVLIMCFALGCFDQQVTQPARLSPAHPAFIATPIGSYSVTMPPNNTSSASGLPQYWIGMGGVTPTSAVSIPPGTAFRVRVGGFVTVSPNPQHEQDFPDMGATYESVGSYGPLGTGGAWNELKIYLDLRDGNGNVTPISVGPDTLAGAAVSGLYYSQGGGSLWVGHAGIWGATGNGTIYDGMYALDGSQLVTVEKITNVVSLNANPSRIRAGTSATVAFTATAADTAIHWGIGSWMWTPDVGTYPNPACQSYRNPCTVGGVSSSGTMTVNVWSGNTPFSAQARVTVYSSFTLDADKTTLVSGDSVTFTPKLDGVTSKVARWLWRGDDSSVVAAPCGPETDTCVQRPNRPGTMWAYTVTTGGDSASKHVTVEPPTLTLTASKSTLAAPGENVTFTVTGSGPVTVLGWSFDESSGTMDRMTPSAPSLSMMPSRPSVGAIVPRNRALPRSIASMLKPQEKMAASRRQSSRVPVPSASSKVAIQGSAWDNCGASSLQCTNFVGTSGTVDVLASVNGDTVRASVQVRVVPCPTNDPVLDDPTIRIAFKDLINSSGPNLPPGDGIPYGSSIGNKREHAGRVYRRPNGTYYFVEDTLALGNECHTARVPQTNSSSPKDVLIAIVHTHPTKTGQLVYGCPPDPVSGVSRKQGPWDTSTNFVGKKDADSTNGGGSQPDWDALRDLPENQVPYPSVDQYVINADGEVWRLLGLDASRPSEQKGSRRVHQYSNNSNPSCNW